MIKRIKRLVRIIAGIILILLGIAGLFLPILQGFLLIFAGLILLEYPPITRLAHKLKERWKNRKHKKSKNKQLTVQKTRNP
jgi:hypothetical protein